MNNDIARLLIESIVRKKIRTIDESPKRSARNLIDMAVLFAKGRFQKLFFESIQKMLKDENSAYYELARELASNVDTDRLITFGLNIGYNSCTMGARVIRQLEAKEQFNIPWIVSFDLDIQHYDKYADIYIKAVSDGQRMGIYSWIFNIEEYVPGVFELAELYQESAFLIFCDPDIVTTELIGRITELKNLMLVIRYREELSPLCDTLRQEKLLYSVFYEYSQTDIDRIANGELYDAICQLHAGAVVFSAASSCSEKTKNIVYQLIKEMRDMQRYPLVPWELYKDSCLIDEVISDDFCYAHFDKEGYLVEHQERKSSCSLYKNTIKDIFIQIFPKCKS